MKWNDSENPPLSALRTLCAWPAAGAALRWVGHGRFRISKHPPLPGWECSTRRWAAGITSFLVLALLFAASVVGAGTAQAQAVSEKRLETKGPGFVIPNSWTRRG